MKKENVTQIAAPLLIVNIGGKEVKIRDFIGQIEGHDYAFTGIRNTLKYRAKFRWRIPFIKSDIQLVIGIRDHRKGIVNLYTEVIHTSNGKVIEMIIEMAKLNWGKLKSERDPKNSRYWNAVDIMIENTEVEWLDKIKIMDILHDIVGMGPEIRFPNIEDIPKYWAIIYDKVKPESSQKSDMLNYLMEYYTVQTSKFAQQ